GRSPLGDLAVDILARVLVPVKGRTCGELFEYYRAQSITTFEDEDPTHLYDLFRPFLFTKIRQQLSRIAGEADPAKANLKRRFKDILVGSEYHTFSPGGGNERYVGTLKYERAMRADCPPISFEELLSLVEECYLRSLNRTQWCRAIFEALNRVESVQNFIETFRLIQAVVIINMKHVDVEGLAPAHPPGAEHSLFTRAITKARTETLRWVREIVLAKFVTNGRLTEDYAQRLLDACEQFLIDLAHSSGVDPLPVYFREVMPEAEHDRYLKNFKHIFETSIHKAKNDFERRLRKYL
ncbi:MAG: hypothetical protein KAW46_12510, partial [candidate division Zixibacteria bacterium]|nr:hypothetical protein [candidate division Zixibacteria bacterium]